ncbi:MAG: MFS transporter [Chitinophagaceae bacterium]|nr:MFS transporter [Chitinophagaceae bacterium]MCW5914115.1 MFS transporter [Chitinophagaceae bacterium]MCZ2395037.1 MFS transporter [Chitinophagales bacterium]
METELYQQKGAALLARLNRIPVWALPKNFLVIIGLGYFFTFYDISNIGFAMPAINEQFHLSNSTSLFLALSVGLIGYIIGSFVIGTLADRFGRYKMLILTFALTAVGSFGDALAPDITTLIIFRFLTGVGVGADLNLVSTYISELAPTSRRGRITLLTFLIGILGQTITPFVALALVPNYIIGWRLLFAIGGFIAVAGLILRVRLPESPRWEVHHGRMESAEKTIALMETNCTNRHIELPAPDLNKVDFIQAMPIRLLLKPTYLRRLIILICMWFLWYIGNYGFLGDAADLITAQGTGMGSSIAYLAVGAIGYPLGTLLVLRIVDRIERKTLIFLTTVVWLAGMLLVGSYAGIYALYSGSFLASLALGSYLQVAYTYTAEMFPTQARATGFALSDGLGHAGGALGAILLPVIISHTSFFTGFAFIGLTGLLAGIIALAGPKTTGIDLEKVSS